MKMTEEYMNELRESRAARNQFFSNAIAKQNDEGTYSVRYAKKNLTFSCNVLAGLDFCNRRCEQCKLQIAHENAIAEIRAGLRKPSLKSTDSREVSISIRKDGSIRITQTLR